MLGVGVHGCARPDSSSDYYLRSDESGRWQQWRGGDDVRASFRAAWGVSNRAIRFVTTGGAKLDLEVRQVSLEDRCRCGSEH